MTKVKDYYLFVLKFEFKFKCGLHTSNLDQLQ